MQRKLSNNRICKQIRSSFTQEQKASKISRAFFLLNWEPKIKTWTIVLKTLSLMLNKFNQIKLKDIQVKSHQKLSDSVIGLGKSIKEDIKNTFRDVEVQKQPSLQYTKILHILLKQRNNRILKKNPKMRLQNAYQKSPTSSVKPKKIWKNLGRQS